MAATVADRVCSTFPGKSACPTLALASGDRANAILMGQVEKGPVELQEIVDSLQQIVFDFAIFESLKRPCSQEQCVQRNRSVAGQFSICSTHSSNRRCPDIVDFASAILQSAIEFGSMDASRRQSAKLAWSRCRQTVNSLKCTIFMAADVFANFGASELC